MAYTFASLLRSGRHIALCFNTLRLSCKICLRKKQDHCSSAPVLSDGQSAQPRTKRSEAELNTANGAAEIVLKAGIH